MRLDTPDLHIGTQLPKTSVYTSIRIKSCVNWLTSN
uniref:Uncharacterized protein n=1 Tax=Anguilla anguilla TaxID=7936 RepID=A0A0E9Q208_ANGAN